MQVAFHSCFSLAFAMICICSGTFGCDDGCPGTYNMKLSVCELECDDSKHAGHAGAIVRMLRTIVLTFKSAVLDINDSLTFDISDDSRKRSLH